MSESNVNCEDCPFRVGSPKDQMVLTIYPHFCSALEDSPAWGKICPVQKLERSAEAARSMLEDAAGRRQAFHQYMIEGNSQAVAGQKSGIISPKHLLDLIAMETDKELEECVKSITDLTTELAGRYQELLCRTPDVYLPEIIRYLP